MSDEISRADRATWATLMEQWANGELSKLWVLVARKSAIKILPPEEAYFEFDTQQDAAEAYRLLMWVAKRLTESSVIVRMLPNRQMRLIDILTRIVDEELIADESRSREEVHKLPFLAEWRDKAIDELTERFAEWAEDIRAELGVEGEEPSGEEEQD